MNRMEDRSLSLSMWILKPHAALRSTNVSPVPSDFRHGRDARAIKFRDDPLHAAQVVIPSPFLTLADIHARVRSINRNRCVSDEAFAGDAVIFGVQILSPRFFDTKILQNSPRKSFMMSPVATIGGKFTLRCRFNSTCLVLRGAARPIREDSTFQNVRTIFGPWCESRLASKPGERRDQSEQVDPIDVGASRLPGLGVAAARPLSCIEVLDA